MPADGSAAVAPFAGVIVILVEGARVVAPAPVPALAAGLALGLAGPVPVQPAASRASAAAAARPASHLPAAPSLRRITR